MILSALLIASLSVWDYPTGDSGEEKARLVAPAVCVEGGTVTVGGQNFAWDADAGMMSARIELAKSPTNAPYAGFLYHNRDGWHSAPDLAAYPGLSVIRFDRVGASRGLHRDFPNALYPYPVFGNASLAYRCGESNLSLPRAMMTVKAAHMAKMQRMYLSNQIWVFPAVEDFPPTGTNGDLFCSLSPYWLATEGRSWSDQYYLSAALEIAAALPEETRKAAIDAGLLAPTVQTILRRSLKAVKSDDDYLSAAAHPAALPANGLDRARMLALAKALKPEAVAPVATLKVAVAPPKTPPPLPENVYATRCASAFAIRSADRRRVFLLKVEGGVDSRVTPLGKPECGLDIRSLPQGIYRLEFDADRLRGRLDLAVFAKSATSDWGAPSYLCFYRPAEAGHEDPFLYPREKDKGEGER